MNEVKVASKFSDREDVVGKKDLKELKVVSYIDNVHLHFLWIDLGNSMVKRGLLLILPYE